MQKSGCISIVIPENGTELEQHAAHEFARYTRQLTDMECDISSGSRGLEKSDNLVSIGETALLKRARSIVPDSKKLNTSGLGKEGFLQKTEKLDNANVLFLAGRSGSDLGILYSVYDYFERFCNVGYFVDGDYVPKGGTLKFAGIDNLEKPRFANRFWNSDMGHFSHMRCQTALWQFPEWKKQIDWMVKRKLNLTLFFVSFEFTGTVARNVFGTVQKEEERYYVGYPATWAYPDSYREELAKNVLAYGRKFGIRFIYAVLYGNVPIAFKEKHPEFEYLSDDYQVAYLKPDDPAAKKYALMFYKELIETFGTDHLYQNTPYCETNMGGTPEKDLEIKIAAAQRTAEVIRELDPQAVWVTDAWDFYANRVNWTEQNIARYFDNLPQDMMFIYETAFDLWDKFYQKKAGYYRGMTWAIGVLNSFSGQDSLHGNLPALDKKIKELLNDPQAGRCDGLFMVPELTNQNVMFWHIVTKYAWNPLEVDLDRFLDEYAISRYGKVSYPVMREVIQIVYGTFYKKRTWMKNTELKMYYQCSSALPNRITYTPSEISPAVNDPFAMHLHKFDNTADWKKIVENTKKALQLALKEKDNQQDNPLYENDMVVLGRMYLGSKACSSIDEAYEAFLDSDIERIEAAAKSSLEYLSRLELLLSNRPDYSLQHMIDYVMNVKGTNSFTPRMIKNACTAGVDYNGNDVYEQIHFYYKPRLERYFTILKEKAFKGETIYERDEMNYDDIKADWADRSLIVPESEKYPGTAIQFIVEKGLD